MRIAVLNECFFSDRHIMALRKLGQLSIYTDTDTEEKTISRMKGADIVIGDQFIAKFGRRVLEQAKKTRLLALNTTSFSYVDLEAADRLGISVANTPGFSKESVAELAIGLIFAVNRKISLMDRLMRDSPLELDPGKVEHQRFMGFELRGKTLGVIGLGRIGRIVAQLGNSLGMEVVAFNRSPRRFKGVRMVSMGRLLAISDVISVNLPLNPSTKGLISKKSFESMKRGAVLVSTSIAETMDMGALRNALREGKLAGAGLDFGASISKGDPLLRMDNVVLTAHAGSFSREAFFVALPEMIVNNVESFVKGKPANIVNGKRS